MSPDTLHSQLERRIAELASPDAEAGTRLAALAEFNAVGFPTRKQERWKYTDLKPLADGDFDLAPPPADAALESLAAARIEQAALPGGGTRYVFVDGLPSAALSSTAAPAGLVFDDSGTAPPLAARTAGVSPLAMLNAAFTHRGVALRVAAGAKPATPVELVFVGSGRSGIAPQLRVAIELGAGAELTVVQYFIDCGSSDAWVNAVFDIDQAAGSRLSLYRLQNHATDTFQTSVVDARIARDAHFNAGYVEVGGRLVRNDINVRLDGPGATTDLFGVTLANGDQHIDNHVLVDHASPRTTSGQTFRAIADDRSRAVFNGKVIVRQDAQRIDARQSSDNLLLSRRAEIDTKPELEIYADDVKCSHGATIGQLDEQQLFYLRARGVDAAAARALLTFAFANSVLDRIADAGLRAFAAARVADSLPDHERRELLE